MPINYSIITNLDKEHLDFYKNYKNLKDAFIRFVKKTPAIGKSIVCLDDIDLKNILKEVDKKKLSNLWF